MSYHKGDVDLEEDGCDYDAREDDGYDDDYKFCNQPCISLPHSCNSWIIGGKDEAEQMIKDLEQAIKQLGE